MRGDTAGGTTDSTVTRGMRPWARGCERNLRNQDDNRRVGTVIHDAQIRAIIPITVQIIVREPVANRRVVSAETQPDAMLGTRNSTAIRVDIDRSG